MESTTETVVVAREIEIDARPETVWEFLVDPDKMVRWMGQAAQLEPHPGGLYRVEVIPGHTARGAFVEVDAPRRLVYTWGWEPSDDGSAAVVPPGGSTIEIELLPNGEGTTLRFAHRGLPSPESAESHARGWDHYFERLAAAGAGSDPGVDPWLTGDM